MASRLRDCPSSPNCVSSQASRTYQLMPSLSFNVEASEAIQRVALLLDQLPRVRVIEQKANYLHASFTSKLLRFVDDVEFWADASTRTLHFRSASRIGYSDLGANRRRMQSLCERLLAEGFVCSPSSAIKTSCTEK